MIENPNNLFPLSDSYVDRRNQSYEALCIDRDTVPDFVCEILKIDLNNLVDCKWFDGSVLGYPNEFRPQVDGYDVSRPYVRCVAKTNANIPVGIYQMEQPTDSDIYRQVPTSDPKSPVFAIVWNQHEESRRFLNDYNSSFYELKNVFYVLRDGLTLSQARGLLRKLAVTQNKLDADELASRTIDAIGSPCRGTIGSAYDLDGNDLPGSHVFIGDLVYYDPGGKEAGWLYRIKSEILDQRDDDSDGDDTYTYVIEPAFTGFRRGSRPKNESVESWQISVVDLTEMMTKFKELHTTIMECATIRGVVSE